MTDSSPIPPTPSSPPPLYDNLSPTPSSTEASQTSIIAPSPERPRPFLASQERDRMDGRAFTPPQIAIRLSHLSSFTHQHTLIVSSPSSQLSQIELEDGDWVIPVTITDPVTPGGNCTIHYWADDGNDEGMAMSTDLTVEQLGYVSGFKELGGFVVHVGEQEDMHEALSALIEDSKAEGDVVERLMEGLKKPKVEEDSPSVTIQLYTITILSHVETNPFEKAESIWMWTKPNSNYAVKAGYWEKTLDSAVQAGEWAAGRELKVLVRGVSKEQKGELFLNGRRNVSYLPSWLKD